MFSYWLNYQFSQDAVRISCLQRPDPLTQQFPGLPDRRGSSLRAGSPDWLCCPAFAAAVFLLHPIQTESVSYIAGRSESLSVLFFLAAFAVFFTGRRAAVSWKCRLAVLAVVRRRGRDQGTHRGAARPAAADRLLLEPRVLVQRHPAELAAVCPRRVSRRWRGWPSSPGFSSRRYRRFQYATSSPGTNTFLPSAAPSLSICGCWFFRRARIWIGNSPPRTTFSTTALSSDCSRFCCWRARPFAFAGAIRSFPTASSFTCC